MGRFKRIVVGVDFSSQSGAVLTRALRIAQWDGAALHVAHVIEPSLTSSLAEAYGIPYVEKWDDLRRMAEERIGSDLAAARTSVISGSRSACEEPPVDVDVHFGNPFVHILREVRDVGAELLVLGLTGSPDRPDMPGRLAVQCLYKAPASVLLVNPSSDAPFRRILACVALSDMCRIVVEPAIRLAHEEGAELCVLHVAGAGGRADLSPETTTESAPRPPGRLEVELERRLREALPPFAADTRGLEMKIWPGDGRDYRSSLVEFARSWHPDLVVLGTRGRPGFEGLPETTTAERILQEVPCSVLAIKPPDFVYDVGGSCRLWRRQTPAKAWGTAGRQS